MAEWDSDEGQTAVCIGRAELTPPYALLLTEGLFEQAEAEARALKAGMLPKENRTRSANAADTGPVSIYVQLAEGERFELSVRQSGAQRFSRPPHSTALPPLLGDAPKAR